MLSDSEYAEGQDSSDQEEEDIEIRPSMTKEHRDLMKHLQFMFPDRFVNNNAESIPAAQFRGFCHRLLAKRYKTS